MTLHQRWRRSRCVHGMSYLKWLEDKVEFLEPKFLDKIPIAMRLNRALPHKPLLNYSKVAANEPIQHR